MHTAGRPLSNLKIALTMGDPTGVGPEVIVKALGRLDQTVSLVLIGDRSVLIHAAEKFASEQTLHLLNSAPCFKAAEQLADKPPTGLSILSLSDFDPITLKPGKPGPEHGRAMREYIEAALELARQEKVQAIVTGPINKKAMLDGGSPHGGHTELLAEFFKTEYPVMMLDSGKLRVALVTTHLPIAQVAAALRTEDISIIIATVARSLMIDFGITRPRLAVAGLNPHAGEQGTLGTEDRDIIQPAIESARQQGLAVSGPHPADSLFVNTQDYDAVICMYHDQGLVPLKMSGFESAVNITLGLPVVRTSVGHGTAPDIAWLGRASEKSMLRAIELARQMAQRRTHVT